MPTEEELKYPVGRFQGVQSTPDLRAQFIHQFRLAPGTLYEAVKDLKENQLLSTYRPGGWTLAQVVHHIVESDINAYPRLKYALTQDVPEVMIAEQGLWAELLDAKSPQSVIDGLMHSNHCTPKILIDNGGMHGTVF